MIKLRIENCFSTVDENGVEGCIPEVKPFDISKYGDGRVHEFDTLGECRDFLSNCRINFTEEYRSTFSDWDWEEIHHALTFDMTDDNMLVATIYGTVEYRD